MVAPAFFSSTATCWPGLTFVMLLGLNFIESMPCSDTLPDEPSASPLAAYGPGAFAAAAGAAAEPPVAGAAVGLAAAPGPAQATIEAIRTTKRARMDIGTSCQESLCHAWERDDG